MLTIKVEVGFFGVLDLVNSSTINGGLKCVHRPSELYLPIYTL